MKLSDNMDNWSVAALQAMARSADTEAAAQAEKALDNRNAMMGGGEAVEKCFLFHSGRHGDKEMYAPVALSAKMTGVESKQEVLEVLEQEIQSHFTNRILSIISLRPKDPRIEQLDILISHALFNTSMIEVKRVLKLDG